MSEQEPQSVRPRGMMTPTLFAGVIIPAISVLVETTTHINAEYFFDPIPTLWHVLLVVFVPVANLQVWLALRRGATERGGLLGAANAFAVGVAFFYTAVYLPLMPLALLALLFFGAGLLPLAPVLALASALVLRRRLKRIAPPGFVMRWPGLAVGVVATLLLVAVLELPATVTRAGLRMAASDTPAVRDEGLRFLRSYGDHDFMLRACYPQNKQMVDLLGIFLSLEGRVGPDKTREIYYRVTGEVFNTRVPPSRIGGNFSPRDTFDFDPDQGGEVIAGKVRGLSLAASRLDGSVDAGAGVSYTEWTLLFKNESASEQEARAEVQLPPGGVVSRLTLWVNGEEREAAFAGRAKTQQAYQQVVRRRRDPVLVTTRGRDRVLVQCYPVPPGGVEMKVRFGVTAPLAPANAASASLRLPHFLERNFGISEEMRHTVWFESKHPLGTNLTRLRPEQPQAGVFSLRGEIRDAELADAESAIRADRTGAREQAWVADTFEGDGSVVRQFIGEEEILKPTSVVVVLDTSQRVRLWRKDIADALKGAPPELKVKLLPAGGNGIHDEEATPAAPATPEEIDSLTQEADFVGGADNAAALARAWDLAAEDARGAVVWIHGPQPLLLRPVEELKQRWERRPDGPTLYSIQTAVGPDQLTSKLDGVAAFEQTPRTPHLRADLENLFAQLAGSKKRLRFVRVKEKAKPATGAEKTGEARAENFDDTAPKTSAHIVRLWANEEVERLLADRAKNRTEEAVELAARYQLVTPVSGAVVLETAEQYREAGLTPVEAGSVPTIPEPETVLLMSIAAALLLYLFFRRRHAPQRSAV